MSAGVGTALVRAEPHVRSWWWVPRIAGLGLILCAIFADGDPSLLMLGAFICGIDVVLLAQNEESPGSGIGPHTGA